MLQAAVQPVPPAINRNGNIDELQPGVGEEAGLVKNDDVENIVGDPNGPVPDVLFHQQPDAQSAGERAHSSCQLRARKPVVSGQMECIPAVRLAFAGLIDIADGRLIDQQGRSAAAGDLDAVAVIPLDAALHLFAVFHDDHHGCFALDLFLVIVIFGVGLLWRASARAPGARSVRSSRSRRSETGSVRGAGDLRRAGSISG